MGNWCVQSLVEDSQFYTIIGLDVSQLNILVKFFNNIKKENENEIYLENFLLFLNLPLNIVTRKVFELLDTNHDHKLTVREVFRIFLSLLTFFIFYVFFLCFFYVFF